ncbi:uncharacterized protein LOC110274700 isoform X2 [Arachis duranensis]|uniref:Uncharacterized protein LOC110274700 isoform X2 n=1 Tax=Arachis duranensis TaxID=130453 RepID=A0A9C6THT3_ARADU|nr:uncharacterized protein LOC110274700 isoform X2 [Arachis duranensis]
MTHEENEPLSNLKTADKVHHIEVEDNCNNSSSSQPKFGSNNGDDYLLKKGERIQDKADEVSRNKTVEEDFVKPILFPGSSRIQDESGKLPDCTVGQVLSFMKDVKEYFEIECLNTRANLLSMERKIDILVAQSKKEKEDDVQKTRSISPPLIIPEGQDVKPIVKPSLSLRPFVSKLRPFGAGTPAMDVLTDVVDNDEGVIDVTNLMSSKSNTKTTPSNRKREQVRAENNKNNLNINLNSVNLNNSTGNIGSNLRKQISPQSSRPTATVGAGRKLAFLPSNAKPPKIPKVNKIAAGGEARNTEDHTAEGNKENKEKEIYCFDVTRRRAS